MPLLRMHMYSRGVQLYRTPTADDRETWQATVRQIALVGRCFVLSCNQFARRSDYPDADPAVPGDDPQAVMSRGGSCIIDPLARVIAGPLYDGPGILTADLDVGEIAGGKYDFDAVGHYARPDVFRLVVNTSPTPPVVHDGRWDQGAVPGSATGRQETEATGITAGTTPTEPERRHR